MSEPNGICIILDVGEWQDAPHAIIENLMLVKTGAITVDASTPSPIGAQVAQLLLAAKKTAAKNNHPFKIENASDEVKESVEALGLTAEFEGVMS